MPIYENRENSDNRVNLSAAEFAAVTSGNEAYQTLARTVKERINGSNGLLIACETWYGVECKDLSSKLKSALENAGMKRVVCISASRLFKNYDAVMEQKHQWITDEPAFGRVNNIETLADYSDSNKIAALQGEISTLTEAGNVVIVAGPGATLVRSGKGKEITVYCDHTADPMLWKMWTGSLIPFETESPRQYGWKEYYYCDFYIMQRHKESIIDTIDFYAEAMKVDDLKLIPVAVYKKILSTLVSQPLKQVRTYSPGPWGAYRYRDLWEIPGLRNNAWNRLAGADLALQVELNGEIHFDMPIVNLLKDHGPELVGPGPARDYPGLIPVEIWLDDGYFPTPQPAERTSMPIHNHPGTEYVKRHFNEPLGRYETYYIVEAYPGANTHMGFNEEACLEEWEKCCRESWEKKEPIPNWQEFIANWKTVVGDLFLIPEGTTHGHGGNQMVLEMDTCGNAAGGEYSFFGYDFMRPTWDDNKGTMTGAPMKMHLDRYFNIDKGCRSNYVRDHLKPRPQIVKWTNEYSLERFDTLPQMPFEIERIHFTKRAEYTTQGNFLHAMTLTNGKMVTIRSIARPEREIVINRLQCALIPAGFGDYEVIGADDTSYTVVLWRLKK